MNSIIGSKSNVLNNEKQRSGLPSLAATVPTNLPVDRTRLIGREQEIESIKDLFLRDDINLVTITGFGGAGKTMLALHVARSMLEHFSGGVFLIDLSAITEPALVLSTIAKTLNVQEEPKREIKDTLTDFLTNRSILFVLDNFEQLVGGAPIIADFLISNPHICMLVTSREALRLRGEQVVAISALSNEDAMQLFLQRAQSLNPAFQLTSENSAIVSNLCEKLDGYPLAIELAAMRTKMFSPQALLARFQSDLGTGSPLLATLTSGSRDLPPRQQTLRNTIAWSYSLLSDVEQKLLRAAAVFRSGFGIESLFSVAGVPEEEALESLASLVDKHLVQSMQAEIPRFMMLETIREFAREQGQFAKEWDGLTSALIIYYRNMTCSAASEIENEDATAAMARIDLEHDNLIAALDEALASLDADLFSAGIDLMDGMEHYWFRRCYFSEAGKYIDRAMQLEDQRGQGNARVSAMIHGLKGSLLWARYDFADAVEAHKKSLLFFEQTGDEVRIGRAMINLAVNLDSIGEIEQGGVFYEKGLALSQQAGDFWNEFRAANNMGTRYHHLLNENDRALTCWQFAFGAAEHLGKHYECAVVRFNMACMFYDTREFKRAGSLLTWVIQTVREKQFPQVLAFACGLQTMVLVQQQDFPSAISLFLEALQISRDVGERALILELFECGAGLCMAQKKYEPAAILLGAVEDMNPKTPMARTLPMWHGREQAFDRLRSELGNTAFQKAWERGWDINFDDLFNFIIAQFRMAEKAQVSASVLSTLTARELDTLKLLAQGKSNEEISLELVIVQKTVEKHVANILRKLGVKNRTEAAAWSIEKGLTEQTK